jgi:putative endopeptidase
MTTRFIRFPLLCAAALLVQACGGAPQPSTGEVQAAASHGIDTAGMDTNVAPGDDFFRYANGTWLRTTEIPPDRSSYGTWSVLIEQSQNRTRDLLEQMASAQAAADSDEQRIGDYYATYLDESAIDAKGLDPLRPELDAIAGLKTVHDLAVWIGHDLRTDVDPLNMTNFQTSRVFGVFISQDLNNPSRNVPYLLQGGLGLPDRDYYLEPGDRMDTVREAYRAHIAAVLKLAGLDDADGRAGGVFELERRIANAHATRTESADVKRADNPWKPDDFTTRAPGLDWPALLGAAHLDQAPAIIVWHPDAITGIAALAGTVPLNVWRDALTFHLIGRYAGVLPKAFRDEAFNFYGKVLSGTPQQRDRWKRAVDATNAALPDAVGRFYVQRYFPPEAKASLSALVQTIVAAFDRRLAALTWMSPETKANARAKLASLRVGIGYPDTWRDDSSLHIVRGDAVGNAERAEAFDYAWSLKKLSAPPDHAEWWISPQTVNALNLPVQNALNFPAAILEPPFYDPQSSPAAQYGAIGAIIGHEISHSFDDQGSQFDAAGKLQNWWTPQDLAHFKAASARLVAQYNAYMPFPDLHENGQLTLSENIADVAGLAAAHDAYRASGGTDDRTFFISFGQSWRSKDREEVARQQVLTDGHALDEYRADTVRNLDGWYDTFDVTPGQRLYLAPDDRVQVW